MANLSDLSHLITNPREDLGAEYKTWLDLSQNHGKATLARAAIALANHGGGFLVIGFAEVRPDLVSVQRPDTIREISQDSVNAAVKRFADPAFHCELHTIRHPVSGVDHPVIVVPGNHRQPIMTTSQCDGVIQMHLCYIRKPGPITEPVQTAQEWRDLIDGCIRTGRENMLDAIRAIVTGQVEATPATPGEMGKLEAFCNVAKGRWNDLVREVENSHGAKFANGYVEIGLSLVSWKPANTVGQLRERLAVAQKVDLSGWPPFVDLPQPRWRAAPFGDYIEAWPGRPDPDPRIGIDPDLADFWRASLEGKLYHIRGYTEDTGGRIQPAEVFDAIQPIRRVGEALLFASRLAPTFAAVSEIAVFLRFEGLKGRYLHRLGGGSFSYKRICQTNQVELRKSFSPKQVADNDVEVVHELLSPLYQQFDFYELPISFVAEEMARLKARMPS